MLAVLCLSLTACDGGLYVDRPLQRGMTEQEVAARKGRQVPDRIIMRNCGIATPNPFPCKVHIYRRGPWSENAVVFEGVRGQSGGEPVSLS
ncbi:hypothetical protein SAMN02990966_00151 [Rhodospirillales bacterium URHD0017]|nr:hypothetical protein SAMN02990966_00151 [Rhodospirillales bacterium URHD0017]